MLRDLGEPFIGWTVDDAGTIHTACGYRCTPQILEGALWLMGMAKHLYGSKQISSDTTTHATVPLLETRDLKDLVPNTADRLIVK